MLTSRHYLKLAGQRLDVAEFLIEHGYTRDGMYLAGYAIECSLLIKALILHLTAPPGRQAMFERISHGESMHYQETLGGILKGELQTSFPLDLVKRYRRLGWRTSIRYDTGRADYGESKGVWKTAKLTYDWVQERIP